MKNRFYSKLALRNIAKNYRFFIPRLIAEAGLLAVFYIVYTLKSDRRLSELHGGSYLEIFMSIGTAVMILLSAILLFYTNSFLMKQRKREFGLYNILGMEKRHVCRVLFCETAFCSVSAIISGLLFGIAFYKLCSLLICRLLDSEVVFGFYFIKADSILSSAVFFAAIDLLTYVFNRIGISGMKPVEMLNSTSSGEREPKVKRALLVIGAVCLSAGYYISVSTQAPLKAILLFFAAVLLVIIGTYFLFVSGSIFILKLLKKNERFYYRRNHMPVISGLLYRMKQNAVGLASIAILATGVLVMISTTVSLYAGMQETLNANYPQHYYISTQYTNKDGSYSSIPADSMIGIIEHAAGESGAGIEKIDEQLFMDVSYNYRDGKLITEFSSVNIESNLAGLSTFTFITEETYTKLTGKQIGLNENEGAVCAFDIAHPVTDDTIEISGQAFIIKEKLASFPINARMLSTSNCYGMVIANETVMDRIRKDQEAAYGANASPYVHRLAVTFTDADAACAAGDAIDASVRDSIRMLLPAGAEYSSANIDSLWSARDSVSGMYGSLLFLGIMLGLVCLFATALIIYYKQISEGYEDRCRFQIMQKIGMSAAEIRKTISVQILFVFFLPLLTAGIHLLFAFPILDKLLHILLLSSTLLFIKCSIIVYLIFALVYILIYTRTARTYYRIVH